MARNSEVVQNGPTSAELASTAERPEAELAQAKRQIAELEEDREYLRRVVLAMSKKSLTADQLVEWFSEKPNEEYFTFEEMMAQLEKSEKA